MSTHLWEQLQTKTAVQVKLNKKYCKTFDMQKEEIQALQQHIADQMKLHNVHGREYTAQMDAILQQKEEALVQEKQQKEALVQELQRNHEVMEREFHKAIQQELEQNHVAMEQQMRQREETVQQLYASQLISINW